MRIGQGESLFAHLTVIHGNFVAVYFYRIARFDHIEAQCAVYKRPGSRLYRRGIIRPARFERAVGFKRENERFALYGSCDFARDIGCIFE